MDEFTIAMPSKGAIAQPTRDFLSNCGLKVRKPNPRQYVGSIPAIPNLSVLFQRVKDVVYKVSDGTAQLGITGLDVVHENPHEDLIVIHDALGYGQCRLVVAVPEAWVDVETITDLSEIAHDFRQNKGRNLRIATTFTHSAREFLHRNGIHHFKLVRAEGAIEAAPTLDYADAIVDLTQTGTTLRENHLKTISGGTIIASQACLIGNRQALEMSTELLDIVKTLAEYIDAALEGRDHYQVTADIQGDSAEILAGKITTNRIAGGLLGPTISPIYNAGGQSEVNEQWHTVTVTIKEQNLLTAVKHLRSIGGKHVIVTPVKYVFRDSSPTYQQLCNQLEIQ